ncbi:MAG: pilin [Gammaproteobacteria bacterium]|nr:pilin [Gammaproteobacteria bacterium]MBU1416621.1 pilin [Gammaproteobacteria bacterium]
MKTRRLCGFTMVEMMAVIAVLTILAMIAVPSYLDRIVKAQIEAALPLADLAKRAVSAYWAGTQEMPADNSVAALPAADKIVGNYVSNVSVVDGAIHMTFGNRANKAIAGKVLTLRPAVVDDAPVVPIAWVCGQAEAPEKMTLMGQDQTSIDPLYLPLECRALKKS